MPTTRRKIPDAFDPEGSGYDYESAVAAGMRAEQGHWGSVIGLLSEEAESYGLPTNSYLMLKGKAHPTWGKAVEAEEKRGFKIIRRAGRYWSVPKDK
jgi:hypothetical protein